MEKIVFTNGCFDILHPGHIDLLNRAKALGTKLIVGINSDDSVRKIKGFPRPFVLQNERALVLEGLKAVDEVRIFDEPTPQQIIEEIKPDVLVKGGDWKINEIIGADFVLKNGGEVFSLSLKDDYSSSKIVEKIQSAKNVSDIIPSLPNDITKIIENSLNQHNELFRNVLLKEISNIENCAKLIYETFKKGKKILVCGDMESATVAQHLVTEFVGRYEKPQQTFLAIALIADVLAMTELADDNNFTKNFARQIEDLAVENDLLIAISTSGNSPNVIEAVMKAREKGCKTIGLTGEVGKKLASLCDESILVPSKVTARIQEVNITINHIWREIIDWKFSR